MTEDGKLQEIATYSATEAPFNVALLIDTSRSTRELLGTIRKAARSFVNQLQPQDRVLIVTFDERVNFLGDFTSDHHQLQRSINSVKSSYLTSIYDAISRTINEKLAPLNGRKAIVVFSDGVDTWSKQATYESTLDLVARSGVLVYAVQYNTTNIGGPPTSPYLLPRRYFSSHFVSGQQDRLRSEFERYRIASDFLRALADQSGARHVRDVGEVVEGATVRQGAVTADGEGEIVAGIALMLKGENSRSVVERIKQRVEQIKKTLPKGVQLIPFYDRTELVARTIHTVARNLIEGAILVIIVLIVLLGNWRGALLVATVIPLSMLFAAICMRIFNVSASSVNSTSATRWSAIRRCARAIWTSMSNTPAQR